MRFIVLLCLLYKESVAVYDKLEDISHYELVEINDEKSWRVDPTAKNTNTKPEGPEGDHPVERRLKFQGYGKQFTLHLKKKDRVPEKLKVISQTRGTDLDFFRDYPVDNCFYEGKVMDEEGDEAHVSSINGRSWDTDPLRQYA